MRKQFRKKAEKGQIMSDEGVIAISHGIMEQNKEAYETLEKSKKIEYNDAPIEVVLKLEICAE